MTQEEIIALLKDIKGEIDEIKQELKALRGDIEGLERGPIRDIYDSVVPRPEEPIEGPEY